MDTPGVELRSSFVFEIHLFAVTKLVSCVIMSISCDNILVQVRHCSHIHNMDTTVIVWLLYNYTHSMYRLLYLYSR